MIRILFCLLVSMSSQITWGQDLDALRWKNRVILLMANEPESDRYAAQLRELNSDLDGLKERKIIVFRVEPERYGEGMQDDNWLKRENKLADIGKSDLGFECILIGLDGGIKLRESTVVSLSDLFALIDRMPMRRREMMEQSKSE